MNWRNLIRDLHILTVLFLMMGGGALSQAKANETEARPADWPEFVLSSEAKEAGIDGKFQLGMSVSAKGKASNIRFFGGPMWPCGAKEPGEVEDVRRAVRQYFETAVFHPATKNGKPRSSEVQITFSLSKRFTDARDSKAIEENLKKGLFPSLVEVIDIHRFAEEVPQQLSRIRDSPSSRITQIQVLVDENGKVLSAGGFRAAPIFMQAGRSLACSAKFKPLTFRNTPLKMSGILTFELY